MQGSIKFRGLKVIGRERWGKNEPFLGEVAWRFFHNHYFKKEVLLSAPNSPPPPHRPPKDHRLVKWLLAQTLVVEISLKQQRAGEMNRFGLKYNCPLVIISFGKERPNSNLIQHSDSHLMFVNHSTSPLPCPQHPAPSLTHSTAPPVIKRYLHQG